MTALSGGADLLRPLVALEQQAAGTFYINAFAVREGLRGQGIGSRLLNLAREKARLAGCRQVSQQVFSQNEGALRLYRRHGFRVTGERPSCRTHANPTTTAPCSW